MYASVRDCIILAAFPSLKEGLDALGFDAVELEFGRDNSVLPVRGTGGDRIKLDTSAALERFSRELSDANVSVSALLMGNNFGSEDLDGEVKWTVDAIELAEALSVPTVRIDAIMHGEQDFPLERNVEVFANAMARILDATSNSDVDLGVENHGFQGNSPEFLDMLIANVDSPRLGVTIDTGNFYWRGHPLSRVYKIIEHFAPYCKHTHVKNIAYPRDKQELQRAMGWEYGKYVSPIREGDIDHARVAQILKSAHYDGDFCLEDESLGKFSPEERVEVLKRDADYFREIL